MKSFIQLYHTEIPGFIEEMAQTPCMQRLQHVGMNCGCEYTSFPMFRRLERYSRFQHSVGVGLIVWHFTRDIRQATAALLHDIATPVFAHVIDFMNGDHLRQESTERLTSTIIAGSEELQESLRRFGLTTADVEDYHRFPVADNDTPRLSADRLEYTFGNVVNFGITSRTNVRTWYADLVVGCNEEGVDELMFTDVQVAEQFALAALQASHVYVSDEDRYAMQMLAEALARCIRSGLLTEADLYTTEPDVIDRLCRTEEGRREWSRFQALHRMTAPEGCPNARRIHAKKRYINPFVRDKGRISSLSNGYAEALEQFLDLSFDVEICGE